MYDKIIKKYLQSNDYEYHERVFSTLNYLNKKNNNKHKSFISVNLEKAIDEAETKLLKNPSEQLYDIKHKLIILQFRCFY